MSILQSCSIKDCNRLGQLINGKRYFTKGYCKSHYRRHLLGGQLEGTTNRELRLPIIEGHIAKVPIGHNAKRGYAIIDADDIDKIEGYNFYADGNGYAVSTTKGSRVLLHHLVAGRPDTGLFTDHINRDKLDNRKSNLRTVTMSQNNMNRRPNSNGKSHYKGVFMSKGVWFASIHKEGKTYRSRHKTEQEAAMKYNKLAKDLFGSYAYINETIKGEIKC